MTLDMALRDLDFRQWQKAERRSSESVRRADSARGCTWRASRRSRGRHVGGTSFVVVETRPCRRLLPAKDMHPANYAPSLAVVNVMVTLGEVRSSSATQRWRPSS